MRVGYTIDIENKEVIEPRRGNKKPVVLRFRKRDPPEYHPHLY